MRQIYFIKGGRGMGLIQCKECGKEISDKATSCPHCGCPVDSTGSMSEGIEMSAAPVRPSQLPRKKNRGCLIGVIIFILFCFGIGFGINEIMKHPEKYQEKSKIEKAVNCTQEEAEEIEKILAKCGIKEYETIERDKGLDGAYNKNTIGYRITVSDNIRVILYLNKKNEVYLLKYVDKVLYKKNKVKGKLSDYTLTLTEISNWQYLCQEKVKEVLKSPSTAKFPNYTEWRFSKNKNNIVVQGYVDAQNGFGAEMRSEFQFKINDKTQIIKSFIFDGEELIK